MCLYVRKERTARDSDIREASLRSSTRQDGNGDSLALLYDRYAGRLYAYACVLAPSPTEAEDIVQDCFMRIVQHKGRLAKVADMKAYLLRILRNEALRRRSRDRAWQQRREAAGTVRLYYDSNDTVADREEAERIRQAMRALSGEQREVVFLKIWEELTFAEIGRVLGIPPNTAASRYRYGLAHLRRHMGDG